MANYTRNMPHLATYWPPGAPDGFGGVGYGSPVTLHVRWEDRADLFRDAQAREVISNAVVYLPENVELRGFLAKGASAAAVPVPEAFEIRARHVTTSLDGRWTLHKVWL